MTEEITLPKLVIEVYFDPLANWGGGSYRARLQTAHRYHSGGSTPDAAIEDLLLTLANFGLSGQRADYQVEVKP